MVQIFTIYGNSAYNLLWSNLTATANLSISAEISLAGIPLRRAYIHMCSSTVNLRSTNIPPLHIHSINQDVKVQIPHAASRHDTTRRACRVASCLFELGGQRKTCGKKWGGHVHPSPRCGDTPEHVSCESRTRACRDVRVAPCCPTSATRLVMSRHVTTFPYAKMHGLNSVSWHDVTWRAKWNSGFWRSRNGVGHIDKDDLCQARSVVEGLPSGCLSKPLRPTQRGHPSTPEACPVVCVALSANKGLHKHRTPCRWAAS